MSRRFGLLALCILLCLGESLPAFADSFAAEDACPLDARFNPTYERLYDTDVIWQIPHDPKAVLYIAHGRFLDIFTFFDQSPNCQLCYGLPEDRTIVLEALKRRYAVIVVKSLGDEWVSWPVETSQDRAVVTKIVTNWLAEKCLNELPMVGFGYSSGGNFTSMMAQYMGFKSLVILDSPGRYEVLEKADLNYPPTIYFYMPKDPNFSGQVLRNAKMLKAHGVQVGLVPLYEFPVTPGLFALRIPCISNQTSQRIFKGLLDGGFLDENYLLKISPWEYDYNSWIAEHKLVTQCGKNDFLPKQVVQELNVAYAFHSMSSIEKDTMFDWFDSSLKPKALSS